MALARQQSGVRVINMTERARVERMTALDRLLDDLMPHERLLAQRLFYRNLARAGATIQGVVDYVRAIFSVDLKPKKWWEK